MSAIGWIVALVAFGILAIFMGHIITAIAFLGWATSRGQVVSQRKELGR